MNAFAQFAISASIAAMAVPASADGILPPPDQAPVAIVAPANDWSGGYVGGTLSYVGARGLYCDDGANYAQCSDPFDGLPEPSPEGAMIGATAGYDWQNGDMVYGVVGDIMFGDLSDVAGSTGAPTSFGCGTGCGFEVSSIAMLRGRVGYAMGDVLPFASAGVAVTHAATFVDGSGRVEDTLTSAVVGIGADYMVSDTMTAGVDLLHLFGGDDNFLDQSSSCSFCGIGDYTATIARVTVAYRF